MGRRILKTRNMNQTNVQAYYKTNVSKLTKQEALGLKVFYIISLQMANSAAREMRPLMRGREKQIIGMEITNRTNRLDQIAIKAQKQGAGSLWQESEERIEMLCELVKQFSIMVSKFNDTEDTIDFFYNRIKLMELEAKNKFIHGKGK